MAKENREAYLAALFAQRVPATPPYVVARDVAEIMRDARSIAALAVAACNYGLTDRQEKRRERLADNVKRLANGYALNAETSGDPRGYTVKLFEPFNPRAGDGFGGGWGVA